MLQRLKNDSLPWVIQEPVDTYEHQSVTTLKPLIGGVNNANNTDYCYSAMLCTEALGKHCSRPRTPFSGNDIP